MNNGIESIVVQSAVSGAGRGREASTGALNGIPCTSSAFLLTSTTFARALHSVANLQFDCLSALIITSRVPITKNTKERAKQAQNKSDEVVKKESLDGRHHAQEEQESKSSFHGPSWFLGLERTVRAERRRSAKQVNEANLDRRTMHVTV